MAGFLSGLSNFLVGSPDTTQQLSRLNPQQSGLINNTVLPAIPGLLSNIQQSSQNGFTPIKERALTEFNTQIVPSLAERFTSLGNQRSSDFRGTLGAAGAGLKENLSALESQFNQQNRGLDQQLLLSLLGLGLQPQFENIFMPGQQGILQHIGAGFGAGLGSLAGPSIGSGLQSGGSALWTLLQRLMSNKSQQQGVQ